jgi:hypothetical protein
VSSLQLASSELGVDVSTGLKKGDQIGRFFAYWVAVSFGQYCEKCESSPNFGLLSFHIISKLCIMYAANDGGSDYIPVSVLSQD